jgi:replicative DNA helicase
LIIVAARPGMGKTAFTLSMARNIAVDQNIPVAFFLLGDVFSTIDYPSYFI